MSEQTTPINGTFFAVVLYPDEDYKHQQFLQYVSMKAEYQVCYISHLPEDEEKKSHVHALIHTKNRMRATSFVKFFSPWISYAECIHSPDSYIRYMLHDTPDSIMSGKIPYSLDDLRGDSKMWKNLVQNSNFVQLREFFRFMREGDTLLDIIHRIEDSGVDPSPYVDYLHSNSFLLVSVCNQEMNKYYKELQYLRKEVFS